MPKSHKNQTSSDPVNSERKIAQEIKPAELHELDKLIGEAFIRAEKNGLSPQIIVHVAAHNAAEYGSCKTKGRSALVVCTALAGILDAIHYNLPRYRDEDFSENFINHVWKTDTDGNAETAMLTTALFTHLCEWLNQNVPEKSHLDSKRKK